MINELYDLSKALDKASISRQDWHNLYDFIPKISKNKPCICITVSNGKVVDLSQLDAKFDKILRKYGNTHGTFPCMNLASLYRIEDKTIKEELRGYTNHPEKITCDVINKIKGWCKDDNWNANFIEQYRRSMKDRPAELQPVAARYEPLQILINETKYFEDVYALHRELEQFAWQMIERGENVALALRILFYQASKQNEYGKISIAFESERLIDRGLPAVSERFVLGFNRHLLEVEDQRNSKEVADSIDAFGNPFLPPNEPMPSVKLAGGFEAKLRTMFEEQGSQFRYGNIEAASYPLSRPLRKQLKSALEWVSDADRENITWIKADKDEILFVYPLSQLDISTSYTAMFKRNEKAVFSEKAKQFIQALRKPKSADTDSVSNQIRIFVLRKIDKGRTKVIYTRQTDANELEKCSEVWTCGCANIPKIWKEAPQTIFPLSAADVLNRFWKQNGEIATNKFKPFPKYHGLELLMEPNLSIDSDLHRLIESALRIGPLLGNQRANAVKSEESQREMVVMLGLLLNRKHIRKEQYMENLPYLYGQLLKAADELHALYCEVVRKGDVPPQLVGSSLFRSAAETPCRTMQMLGQRIMPYYSWAKSYRLKNDEEHGKEIRRARWLYCVCERIVNKLQESWTAQTRFNDEEKAQLFIGYLAAFTKKEGIEQDTEEEVEHE